jgi:hypothetical protein
MQPSYLRTSGAVPSPCGKTAQFPPENMPSWTSVSDALKLTYLLHFRRVLLSTSPSLTWLCLGPSVADTSTLAVVASTPRDASHTATLIALSSAKLSLRRSGTRRSTRRGEVVASFLLSNLREKYSAPSAVRPSAQTCWRALQRIGVSSHHTYTAYIYCSWNEGEERDATRRQV